MYADDRPDPRSNPSPALRAAGVAVGAVLGGMAAVRRGKAVHPTGVAYSGELEVPGVPDAPAAARLFTQPGRHPAVVRFSRSLGVPRPIPDLLGISLRLPDVHGPGRHQDFMLVTSADLPIVHHGFLPAADVWQRPYTSSLPYRAGDDLFLVGALPDPTSPRPGGDDEFDRLDKAGATGRLRFGLAVAPIGDRFRSVATLHIGERLADELDALRYNPFNTGGGLEPAGFINRLRAWSYPMSQAAWRRTRPGGGAAQEAAEVELSQLRRRA